MAYTKVFEKEYENGWMPFPSEETMVTAHALNEYDDTLEHIEDYLFNYDANDNIAEEYSDSSTYNQGDYAIYYGVLYKAIVDIDTSESFDPDHWTRVLVTDEIGQGGGGTTVVANPVGEPTDDLETIQIGGTIYDIPGGGGGNANIWTGTRAEYEAQASQIADDTVVLITDDEERTQAFDVYSTDEQAIGTWIDNKTIYRKVVKYTGTFYGETSVSLDTGLTNVSEILPTTCINLMHSGDTPMPLPYSHYNASNNIGYFISADFTKLNLRMGTSYTSSSYIKQITAIYEYTKTV